MPTFRGFPPEALKFFASLKRNNRREWFQPRKEIFESTVKAPMIELVLALNADFAKFAPLYARDPKQAIFRIYRDTRFSPDKSPYKTHLAAVFPKHGGDRGSNPGFYFSISDKEIGVAGGLYEPLPEHLLAVRSWLLEHHAEFRKAAAKCKRLLGDLHGESLTRVPKGFDPAHPAADLLKMKRWTFYTTLPARLATTPRFHAELVQRFKIMLPAIELLAGAASRAKKRAVAADWI
ncbi:MAG TPA: DUF2461 domain-containing protein [Bryobacteraceae bacterium]|nr:DUF2461 domain-containing protein [Bryobacteraceae bacterium]